MATVVEGINSRLRDIENGHVGLRRRKQFAMLQPGARWLNLGLVLPG